MVNVSGESMQQIGAEKLDEMSNGTTGSSVLASRPWRLFTSVERVEPLTDQDGIIGIVRASGIVDPSNPIFGWHFVGRPVLPGALLQDQLLQLAGVYTILCCAPGDGVARLSGLAKYLISVTPATRELVFETDILDVRTKQGRTMVVARGRVLADGKVSVEVQNMKTVVTHPI